MFWQLLLLLLLLLLFRYAFQTAGYVPGSSFLMLCCLV